MMQYMIEAEMPEVFTDDILDIIPDEINRLNHLLSESVVSSYVLSSDRKKFWMTVNAENEDEVYDILESFAMTSYVSYHIHALAFLEVAPMSMPAFSLN